MKSQQLGTLILLATTLASIPLALALPATKGSTLHSFLIVQNNSTGAGNQACSGQANCFNSTSPGPTITVNQGDTVSITVRNNDTTTHTFNIATPYTAVSTGNMNPGQVKTLSTFTASTSGSFNYQCNIHPAAMKGTFKVNAAAPITPTMVLTLLATTTAAAYLTMRRRR